MKCVSNCSFSVLFQGSIKGNFHSSRGIRQGDPLSPFLFILAAEVLSRGLTKEFSNGNICPFSSPTGCDPIKHLLYADDTLIFLNGRSSSIKGCLNLLNLYCECSGQRVNAAKSSFLLSNNAPRERIQITIQATKFQHKKFPLEYLGVPLFQGRAKAIYFEGMIKKVRSKIDGWKNKLLSKGGKLILLKHILLSMPVYQFSAFDVPKAVIKSLESIFSSFIWGNYKDKPNKKWISWDKISTPTASGCLGIRPLPLVLKSFRCKST